MPDKIEALVNRLWEIKDGRSFAQMADEAGINRITLWRVMNRERRPAADTMAALLGAYPELAALFLPQDSPDGNTPVPDGILEAQA